MWIFSLDLRVNKSQCILIKYVIQLFTLLTTKCNSVNCWYKVGQIGDKNIRVDFRLDKGVIVYICDSKGVRDIYETDGSEAIATSEPLVVLVRCTLLSSRILFWMAIKLTLEKLQLDQDGCITLIAQKNRKNTTCFLCILSTSNLEVETLRLD